jgi:hypothetical protein
LRALQSRGLRLACLTNKPTAFARELLLAKGLAGFFSVVFGGDAFERIPGVRVFALGRDDSIHAANPSLKFSVECETSTVTSPSIRSDSAYSASAPFAPLSDLVTRMHLKLFDMERPRFGTHEW